MDNQIEQLKEQLKKQEKLASLGLLSAGIAHEIQNSLLMTAKRLTTS